VRERCSSRDLNKELLRQWGKEEPQGRNRVDTKTKLTGGRALQKHVKKRGDQKEIIGDF